MTKSSRIRTYKSKLRALGIRKNFDSAKPHRPDLTGSDHHQANSNVDLGERVCIASTAQTSRVGLFTVAKSVPSLVSACCIVNTGHEAQRRVSLTAVDPYTQILNPAESFLLASRSFVVQSQQNPWNVVPDSNLLKTRHFRRRIPCIWHTFQQGLAMLERGATEEAFAWFQEGCASASSYVIANPRSVIIGLFTVMGNPHWARYRALSHALLRFLASLCFVHLGKEHPLHAMFSHSLNPDLMITVAEPCLRLCLDLIESHAGSHDPAFLKIQKGLFVQLTRQREFDASERIIRDACILGAKHYGHDSAPFRSCLRRLGILYLEQNRLEEAERVFMDVVGASTILADTSPWEGLNSENRILTCQNLSVVHLNKGDREKSDYWAEMELQVAKSIYGSEDEYVADCLRRQAARKREEPVAQWFSRLEFS